MYISTGSSSSLEDGEAAAGRWVSEFSPNPEATLYSSEMSAGPAISVDQIDPAPPEAVESSIRTTDSGILAARVGLTNLVNSYRQMQSPIFGRSSRRDSRGDPANQGVVSVSPTFQNSTCGALACAQYKHIRQRLSVAGTGSHSWDDYEIFSKAMGLPFQRPSAPSVESVEDDLRRAVTVPELGRTQSPWRRRSSDRVLEDGFDFSDQGINARGSCRRRSEEVSPTRTPSRKNTRESSSSSTKEARRSISAPAGSTGLSKMFGASSRRHSDQRPTSPSCTSSENFTAFRRQTSGFSSENSADSCFDDSGEVTRTLSCDDAPSKNIYDNDASGSAVFGFFKLGTTAQAIQRQHLDLGHVARQIFVMAEELNRPSVTSTNSPGVLSACLETCSRATHCWALLQRLATQLSSHMLFASTYIVLTIYVLFCPDIVDLLGHRYLVKPVVIVNTIVFFLFAFELVVSAIGSGLRRWAWISVDVICLASLLTDTIFMESFGQLSSDDDGARLSRVARSSRAVRLLRIVRIARVARLLPHLMALFRRQSVALGQQILLRRLWRGFCLLDTDKDGHISEFDMKVYYVIMLKERPRMLRHSIEELISFDKEIIDAAIDSDPTSPEDSTVGRLDFQKFSEVLMVTMLGKDLLAYHVENLEMSEGVWSLAQTLNDNTAVKVCICVLILLVSISLLELDTRDRSALTGLAQLDHIAKSLADSDTFDLPRLCHHVTLYMARHAVLLLHLDGKTFVDAASCLEAGFVNASTAAAMESVRGLVRESQRREQDLLLQCAPHTETCDQSATDSIALLDTFHRSRSGAAWSIIATITVILLLLCFVFILNGRISSFTTMVLQPLWWLVDDMLALSSLELLTTDKDMPEKRALESVEELNDLGCAFHAMQSAIRCWSKFVPPVVVQRLFSSGVEAGIGVNKAHVTILFCDIVGFDELCAGLGPAETIDLLSEVGNHVAEVIQANGGTLLEFIGDEMVAAFNVPKSVRHHSFAGLDTSRQIHRELDRLNPFVSRQGSTLEIRCRCGVHTAHMLAGNIGSPQRIKYGLLGDGINLAARLKGLNSRYGTRTLVSDSTLKSVHSSRQSSVLFRPVDVVAVKGKARPTMVYEVMPVPSEEDPRARKACETHKEAFRLYQERMFSEAARRFQEVRMTLASSKDIPSRTLYKRCQLYLREPPPEDWDGVDRLKMKTFEEDPDDEEEDRHAKELHPELRELGNSAGQYATPYTSMEGMARSMLQAECEDAVVPTEHADVDRTGNCGAFGCGRVCAAW